MKQGQAQGSGNLTASGNIYLHYLFDLWAEQWPGARDTVRQHHQARLEKFSLALHPDKIRLIAFGRFAAGRRARAGLCKPETFDHLD